MDKAEHSTDDFRKVKNREGQADQVIAKNNREIDIPSFLIPFLSYIIAYPFINFFLLFGSVYISKRLPYLGARSSS